MEIIFPIMSYCLLENCVSKTGNLALHFILYHDLSKGLFTTSLVIHMNRTGGTYRHEKFTDFSVTTFKGLLSFRYGEFNLSDSSFRSSLYH